jgi:hypothetical protein
MEPVASNESKHPPGWYPDPSGAPGQAYWDGQRWQPPPAAGPTPWGQIQPQLNKGRGF